MKISILSAIIIMAIIWESMPVYSQVSSSATSTVTFAVNRPLQVNISIIENDKNMQLLHNDVENGIIDASVTLHTMNITASQFQSEAGTFIGDGRIQNSLIHQQELMHRLDRNVSPTRSEAVQPSAVNKKDTKLSTVITITD